MKLLLPTTLGHLPVSDVPDKFIILPNDLLIMTDGLDSNLVWWLRYWTRSQETVRLAG